DLSVEGQLVDFPIVQGRTGVRVRGVEELPRTGCNADCIRDAGTGDLRLEAAFRIEYLDTLVFPVAHVNVVLGVDGNRVRQVELPWLGPSLASRLDKLSILVELRDA